MSKLREGVMVAALLASLLGFVSWLPRTGFSSRDAGENPEAELTDVTSTRVSIFRAEWSADERHVVTLVRGLLLGSSLVVHDLAGETAPWPIDFGGVRIGTIALSPDGRHLLIGKQDGKVVWFSLESSEQTVLWETEEQETAISAAKISRDGRLAFVGTTKGDVLICDTSGRHTPRVWKGHSGSISVVELSHDEKRILTASMDCSAVVWDLSDQREVLRLRQDEPLTCGAFSSDDRGVFLAGIGSRMWKFDVETRQAVWEAKVSQTGLLSLALSADGMTLASAGFDKKIMLWDATTGTLRRELAGHRRTVSHVRFSVDGSKLLSAGYDGAVMVWDVIAGQVATRIDYDWMANTAL